MNKVANWVFGSFFRTIGRLLVFVLLGFIIAHFVDFGSLIDNFRITDLFLEQVKADTFLNTFATNWTNAQGQALGTISEYAYQTATTTTQDGQFTANEFYINLVADQSKGSYIEIPFYMTIPRVSTTTSSTVYGQDICTRYDCALLDTSTNTCSRYTCVNYSTGQDSTISDRERVEFQSVVYAIIVYNTGYVDVCDLDKSKNNLVCPITSNQPVQSISRVVLWSKIYAGSNSSGYTYQVGLGIRSRAYKNDTQSIIDSQNQSTNAINNQTQQQQQQHNEMMNDTVQDSNETESAFEDFESFLPENGIITQLITLPITLYTNILNSVNASCSAFSLGNIFGKPLTLPCINISNYLGSNLWGVIDILMSGFFVLVIARKLIKVFNSMSSMKDGDVLGD